MPDASAGNAFELRGVEKQYGALRPLRVRDLRIAVKSRAALLGFDAPAAETFVNLITGAALPDRGEVVSFGQATSAIADGDAWLAFVERFGFVSDRAALLDAMTVAQNLALPFDLDVDPVPASVMTRVGTLAAEVDLDASRLGAAAGDADSLQRAKARLARALALDPAALVLEHPTATLEPGDANAYAALVHRISEQRGLTVVALTLDETFAKALGGRRLAWQPATGEFRERKTWF